ncbi:hypothetical protein AAFF_G00257510 [Aldrovandia affinis]|uniref:Uncharacterized protein n=1 Tax=Aldrovandia affinis TaxID=143900 RepID=A0AAD7SUC1_9TELE|nr:hypothetical protein AAFF_G00257510 [Aldrovandia affinis]
MRTSQQRKRGQPGLVSNMAGEPRQLAVDVVRCAVLWKKALPKLTQGNRISSGVITSGHPTVEKTSGSAEDSAAVKICVDLQPILAAAMEPEEVKERSHCGSDSNNNVGLRLMQTLEQQQRAQLGKKSLSLGSCRLEVPWSVKHASFPPVTKPSDKFRSRSDYTGISASHTSLPLIDISELLASSSKQNRASETVPPLPRILLQRSSSLADGNRTSESTAPQCKEISLYSTEQLLQRVKAQVRERERRRKNERGVLGCPDPLFLAGTLKSLKEELIHPPGLDTECPETQPTKYQRTRPAMIERGLQCPPLPPERVRQPVTLSLCKRNISLAPWVQHDQDTQH